ncbi:MAG: hypothetical protein GY851_30460 [bacterium]|nr:hypothetical protein [bacterium]
MCRMGLIGCLTACVVLGASSVTGADDTITVPLTLTDLEDQWAASQGLKRLVATGEFEHAGQSYAVEFKLGDDWNGFLIPGTVYFTGDPDEGYRDNQPFPHVLGVGGKLYSVDILLEPPQLMLTPYAGPVAMVRIPIQTERLSLHSPCKQVLLYRPGTKASVPVGDYELSEYQCVKKDKDGQAWYLCAAGTKDSPSLKVRAGAEASLGIGGPYMPSLEVDGTRSSTFRRWRKVAYVDFGMRGKWNENPTTIFPVGGNTEPPGFIVRNPDGETVVEGAFRYG